MPRSIIDEALVLRTYNVGEADIFAVLLLREHGRLTARGQGVRKTTSRRRGLLPFHTVDIVLDERSSGHAITGISCRNAHATAWRNPQTFVIASLGIELMLRLTEEGVPLPHVFELVCSFLGGVNDNAHLEQLYALYALQLLNHLGLLPSLTHACDSGAPLRGDIVYSKALHGFTTHDRDPYGQRISPELSLQLGSLLTCSLSSQDIQRRYSAELPELVGVLVESQLGTPLRAASFCTAMSSFVAPTSHVSGRAS